MKVRRVFILALLSLALESHAQYGSLPEFNSGARGLALGQSALITSRDALAHAWNPAIAGSTDQITGTFAFAGPYHDIINVSFGVLVPVHKNGAFGASYFRHSITNILLTDAIGDLIGIGAFKQEHLLLTYGRELSRSWAIGANAKFVWQSFSPNLATGPENVGIDLGVIYRAPAAHVLTRNLAFGVVIDNLVQPTLKHIEVRQHLPREVRFIAEKGFHLDKHHVNVLANIGAHEKPDRSGTKVQTRLGIEYSHARLLSLRAGFHEGNVNIGFGVQYYALELDYALFAKSAYYTYGEHAVSLTYRLQK